MNDNFNFNKLSGEIIRSSGGKITQNDLNRLKAGDLSALMGALSENEIANLKAALSSKAQRDKILNTKQAQGIMNELKKGTRKDG